MICDGRETLDNRFVIEGHYKYKYNNGHLAMADTHAAAVNFLNALERIPTIIKQYEEKNEVLEREIPQLREIAGKTWKKEDELKQLKSELAALDRKIQLELAPKREETPEHGQEQKDGHTVPKAENVPKPDIPTSDYIRDHIIIGRPGIPEHKEARGMKI